MLKSLILGRVKISPITAFRLDIQREMGEKYFSTFILSIAVGGRREGLGAVAPPFGPKCRKFGKIVFYSSTHCETKQIKPNNLLTHNL